MIRIPPGGLGKFNREQLADFILNCPAFQQEFPAAFDLPATLNDFKTGKTEFFPLFQAARQKLPERSPQEIPQAEGRVIYLYSLLWLHQDQGRGINLPGYLDTLSPADQTGYLLSILNFFGSGYFTPESYPYFNKVITGLCNRQSPFGPDAGLLDLFLKSAGEIFPTPQAQALADHATRLIAELPRDRQDAYNNCFFVLSRYAGPESKPYFDVYFEHESQAFNLAAVSGYFRKHWGDNSFQSMLQRKVSLLRDSLKELEQLEQTLDPQRSR